MESGGHSSIAVTEARALLESLAALRRDIAREAEETLDLWKDAVRRTDFQPSAENLAHYLAFRKVDLRPLQPRLAHLGLSSLGRCEAHVMASLDAVMATLSVLAGASPQPHPDAARFTAGRTLLGLRQVEIFGADPEGPRTRIMVTLPTDAADDPGLVRRLILEGADIVRINCAHDDATSWERMIRHVRQAARNLSRDVRILMDLAGPKVRIGEVNRATRERLYRGDHFILSARLSPRGDLPEATVLPEVLLDALAPGATVWINDGKIGARVLETGARRAVLEVISAREKGEKLKPEKGVNAPGTELDIPALTEDDIADLDFVATHADIVGYSFVQRPADVTHLLAELRRRRGDRPLPAIMLKIETPLAVRNLPRLIVKTGGETPVAVMIARGDLAVEIGLERLSEMQEQILWLCEAAHVPVVWATQVLDNMVKDGIASRAEATDAAMGQRAECVMLNKGPYLAEAVGFLDGILRRMDRHQMKKSPWLAPLKSWQEPQVLG